MQVRAFVRDFPWFHRWIGLIGNTMFFIATILTVFSGDWVLSTSSTWLFILGSFGMMVDSYGEKLFKYDEESMLAKAAHE